MTVEVGGPAIYENSNEGDLYMTSLNGRVRVVRIENGVVAPGQDAFVVQGDDKGNVGYAWVAMPHELRGLGGR